MSISADTHLFGSKQGYQTLAKTPGVAQSESDELSTFGFGQTGSSSYLDHLIADPSAYGRQLQSGRIGITKCLKGNPDDAGRPTLLLCTLLISPRDYECLAMQSLESVISDSNVWNLASFESGQKVQIRSNLTNTTRSVREEDLIILDAWLTSQDIKRSVSAFSHESKISEFILAFPQVIDANDRLQFRWGINLLSGDVAVDVCTLSTSAKQSGRRRINQFNPEGPIRNDVIGFLRDNLKAGALQKLPSLESLLNPVSEPTTLQHESIKESQNAEMHLPLQSSHKRRVLAAAAISFAGIALITSVLALSAGIFRKNQDATKEQVQQTENLIAKNTPIIPEEIKSSETTEPPTDKAESQNDGGEQNTSPSTQPEPATDSNNQEAIENPKKSNAKQEDNANEPAPSDKEENIEDDFNIKNDQQQDDNPAGLVDSSANEPLENEKSESKTEEKIEESTGTLTSESEQFFKEMKLDDLFMWFGDNPLPTQRRGTGTKTFDAQFAEKYLQPFVLALEEVRERLVLNSSKFGYENKQSEKDYLIETFNTAVTNIHNVFDDYIEYLKAELRLKANLPSGTEALNSDDELKNRLEENKLLTENAELCLKCCRIMMDAHYEIERPNSPTKLSQSIRQWIEDLGKKNPKKGLLGKLSHAKDLLEKRIESRQRKLQEKKKKLEIKTGSKNDQSDN